MLCQFHGGWLVDLADSRGPAKNNLLKSLISDADDHECCDWPGPQYNDQWWIGATCNGPHSSHNWGNWTWDHNGAEVSQVPPCHASLIPRVGWMVRLDAGRA